MKSVGIICDDYKLPAFKKELKEKGFTDYKIHPYTLGGVRDHSLIKVEIQDDQVEALARVCRKIEYAKKRSN